MFKKISSIVVFVSLLFFSAGTINSESTKGNANNSGLTQKSFPVSFYLGGGYSFINGDDINNHITGNKNLYTGELAFFNWDKIKSAYNIDFEITYHLTHKIGLGIGGGYFSLTNSGEYGWKDGGNVFSDQSREYSFRAYVINGNIYYTYPIISRMKVFAAAGVDVYFGKLKHVHDIQWDYHLTQSDPYWHIPISDPSIDPIYNPGTGEIHSIGSSEKTEEMNSTTLGFHGGLGIEVNINSTFSIVAGGYYRLAKLGALSGEKNYSNSLGDSLGINGTWWYVEDPLRLEIEQDQPENSRKAELDLSGFTVQIGIRARFSFRLFGLPFN
jgi:hypothetical protein